MGDPTRLDPRTERQQARRPLRLQRGDNVHMRRSGRPRPRRPPGRYVPHHRHLRDILHDGDPMARLRAEDRGAEEEPGRLDRQEDKGDAEAGVEQAEGFERLGTRIEDEGGQGDQLEIQEDAARKGVGVTGKKVIFSSRKS